MNSSYQTGGSLALDAPTYINRQADEDLYADLLAGNFRYVLTSRQMGKSSLRIRVMDRLQQSGVRCSAIDLTGIGSQNISASEWYYGILDLVIEHLKLTDAIDLDEFWNQHQNLSPLQRLSKFVDMLLSHIAEPVVVFVDEIDSTINLKFDADDFFVWIRYCFNLRLDKPQYNRLTFCLLGVATPTDLIQDKTRTPFNIGERIDPQRFQVEQLMPLMGGLSEQVEDIEVVCKAIHDWTGGQPYLTQRLCQLIQSELGKIELGQEQESIARLVENRIITNWEYQDEQSHLKTIRDRLLKDDERAVRLLGLYQQVLQGVELSGDNPPERMALLLTGLVILEQERLFPYNEIYRRVFSDEWVAQELAKLRPYAESLQQWLADSRDEKYLLTGQGFLDAQQWSLNRRLTEEDSQYLAASQKLHTENVQATADAIIRQTKSEAEKITQRAKKRAALFGIVSVGVSIIAVMTAWFSANKVTWLSRIERESTEASTNFPMFSIDRYISAMKIGRELQKEAKESYFNFKHSRIIHVNEYSTYTPIINLQEALGSDWYESNRFSTYEGKLGDNDRSRSLIKDGKWVLTGVLPIFNSAETVNISGDGQTIIFANKENVVKLLKRDGLVVNKFNTHIKNTNNPYKSVVRHIEISNDGQTIVSGSDDETVKVWKRDGSLITTLNGHQGKVNSVAISGDGQTIVLGSDDKTVKVWKRDGSLITTLNGHQGEVNSVAISGDGQIIVSGSDDKTVKVWRQDGSLVTTLNGHQGEVNSVKPGRRWGRSSFSHSSNPRKSSHTMRSVAISEDGQTIVSGSDDKTVKVWKRDGSFITTLSGHQDEVRSIAISGDGQTIVSGSDDKTVKVWKRDGSLITTLSGHQDGVDRVKISTDGQTIVSSSKQRSINHDNAKIKIWQRNMSVETSLACHQDRITSIGIDFDGKTIISACNRDETPYLTIWGRNGFPIAKNSSIHLSSTAISANGQLIVTSDVIKRRKRGKRSFQSNNNLSNSINIWDRPNSSLFSSGIKIWDRHGLLISSFARNESEIIAVVVSGDGQTIASSSVSDGETIKLWRKDGSLVAVLTLPGLNPYAMAMSADGQTIVSVNENKIVKLWRKDGSLVTILNNHQDIVVNSVAISGDGQTIISCGDDKTVKVWKRDGSLITTLNGHQDKVNSVAVSGDGQTIVSGSDDETVKVWKRDGSLITTLSGHQDIVNSIAVSGDGRTIVSRSIRGVMKIYHFDLDYLLAKGCEQLKDYLNSHPEVNREEICPK
jgi:WD40 repeat protein